MHPGEDTDRGREDRLKKTTCITSDIDFNLKDYISTPHRSIHQKNDTSPLLSTLETTLQTGNPDKECIRNLLLGSISIYTVHT